MNVPSWAFLGFALAAAVLFNLSGAAWWRRIVLLAANLAFLATFATVPQSFLPYLAFLALGFLGVRVIKSDRRIVANAFILATLLCFIWLKRYAFLPDAALLSRLYVTVGVSYVFFRVMSLLVDLRDGALTGPIDPISYINYALNFTCLVSGPIQRFQDYHRMEAQERLPLDAPVVGAAVERIVVGFFKVFLLSSALIALQKDCIAALDTAPGWAERVGDGIAIALLYPIYLYLNFSGYTDFVIGVARFFRLVLPENFKQPFTAENFIDFWSRWHITLSSWLRTYVYTPFIIALMRRFPAPGLEPLFGVLAFFVTFFLVGVWHGQTSEFLFFGLLQGGGVAANKLYQIGCERALGRKPYRKLCADPLYRAVARGLTFAWFAFTLLWFWASWGEIGRMAAAIGIPGLIVGWLAAIAIATLALTASVTLRRWAQSISVGGAPVWSSRYLRTVTTAGLVVIIMIGVVALAAPAPQIVYKAF